MSDLLDNHLQAVRNRHATLTDLELSEMVTERLDEATSPHFSAEKRQRLAAEANLFNTMLSEREPPELTPIEQVQRLKEINPAAAQALEHGLKMEADYERMQTIQGQLDELGEDTDTVTETKRQKLRDQMERALETTTKGEADNPMVKRDAAVDTLRKQAEAKRREAAQTFDVFNPEVSERLEAEADEIGRQASHVKAGGSYE